MYMTFRWFGPDDEVTLRKIRQIPGIQGIVSALHDVPVGDVWPKDRLADLKEQIEAAGFRFSVAESIPVHEDIKLGRPARDRWIEHYCRSISHLGELGVPVLCYNFMPVFDWMRTDLAMQMEDGSTTLAYDQQLIDRMDLTRGLPALPVWPTGYDGPSLAALLAAYRAFNAEALWEHLAYFLERVAKAAEEVGVKLALHPDDPPWPIFGVPRIITDGPALERVLDLADSPANGITFCTGSLALLAKNDLPVMIRRLGSRVHFSHCRNVRITGDRAFHETPHPSCYGQVDMLEVMQALRDVGFNGPMRSDHGRMIWDEQGRPAYGLHDRALGAAYLLGLWEAVTRGLTPGVPPSGV